MRFFDKIRIILGKNKSNERLEVVASCNYNPKATDAERQTLSKELLGEVDFSYRGDLETYVRTLRVPREVIERWVSAGLLFPEEMIMAEKMIKIMRRKDQE